MAPRDDDDKENADNGGKPTRSKRSMKPASKSGNDDDLSVFDPENDEQLKQSTKQAKTAGKAKSSTNGADGKSAADREKELTKLKVCTQRRKSVRATSAVMLLHYQAL